MGRSRRLIRSALTLLSLARIRFLSVTRLSLKRPFLVVAQTRVNPRNENVSGLPSPRSARFKAANRPNWIRRVFSAFNSSANSASLSRRSAQNPLGVLPMLKPHHEVVAEAHDDNIA